jgi:DNA-directed RNA polymerase specialized sigma24 family protein
MIEVKLEDFEKYRTKLSTYALNLSKTFSKVSNNIVIAYHKDKAKDIVQDTYLDFHSWVSSGRAFESEHYLFNFLKTSLYRRWTKTRNIKYKSAQFYKFTGSGVYDSEFIENLGNVRNNGENSLYQKDINEQLSNVLTDKQKLTLNLLLTGYSQIEIAKLTKVSKQSVNDMLKKIKIKLIKSNMIHEIS